MSHSVNVVLAKYLDALTHLHRNMNKARGAAPHKPILLLAILHEVEAGRITQNLVPVTPELVASFHLYWQALVSKDAGWNPKLAYPFRYLKRDGFWELVKNNHLVSIEHEPTLNQLASLCDGGQFAEDLWPLIADPHTRGILRHHLQTTYFTSQPHATCEVETSEYLSAQAEMLKQQAQAPFRLRPTVKEQSTDGYFVRNRLFPKVVKELYGFSCCVCSLSARLGNSSLIDGAHILPFAEYHNDDPRNGLALCKNHHWGFDCGAWSLTDTYEVLVSPKLANDLVYIQMGQLLLPPRDNHYRPDPEALKEHRKRWGFPIVI